ncbi:YcnI family copper-binding membrane protein [Saccharothrix sp. ST-888]|uniref:YcnI family copper-binding membrane protein n=1 Tax=Saccharothrix sp. ST-888 TaxID=1427391 RepID=UPI0005EC8559|nr:YcnI family protein [Saccharothrix sp. ST-888]KJK57612.1 membrane protein [Saccharothrix sp. ST-888]
MRITPARRIAGVTAAAATAVIAFAVPAFAHVTVQPGTAQQGDYTAVAFRVPDESDTASTVKLEVNLPMDHPMASVRVLPLPGWTAVLEKSKLDKPLKSHGQDITEAVSKITWTADGSAKIAPGQFQEFKVSLGALPADTDKLTFKALQTYDNGDIVRWIDEAKEGQAEPAHPAPTLTLTKAPAAAGDHHGGAVGAASAGASQDDKADNQAAKSSDSTARTLGVVGIVVGVIGAALGVAGLRRKSSGTAS